MQRDKKISNELKPSVESLQNVSWSFPVSVDTILTNENTSTDKHKQLLQQTNQLVTYIDTNVDSIINMTVTQQQAEESNFLNQVAGFLSSIFTGQQQNSDNVSIHPMRFAELVDSVFRNYGDAYDVDCDMTDMSNIAMKSNDSSVVDKINPDVDSNNEH